MARERLRTLIVEPVVESGDWHYASLLGRALAEAGVDVSLATLFPKTPVAPLSPIPVYPIGPLPSELRWSRRLSITRVAYHALKIWALRRLILELRPDVVHLQKPLGAGDFAYLSYIRRLGPRLVYTVFGLLPDLLAPLQVARFRRMDLILVHDTRTQIQLIEAGISASRVRKIPHGNFIYLCQPYDLASGEARRSLGLHPEARVVLFFGSIEWRKGLDRLIDAFAFIAQEFKDVYLVISGYPNEDFSPYEARIEDVGVRNRVMVNLGWVPFSEMQRYFRAATLVALPYRRISQSGVLQLAYAYERPVVVTDAGGLAEAVLEDGTGVVASTSEPRDIAAAMRELLSDPERAALMGRRGRILAATKYAWPRIASDIARYYRAICDSDDAAHT